MQGTSALTKKGIQHSNGWQQWYWNCQAVRCSCSCFWLRAGPVVTSAC